MIDHTVHSPECACYTQLQRQAIREAIKSLEHAKRMLQEAGVPEDLRNEVAGVAHCLKPLVPEKFDWRLP